MADGNDLPDELRIKLRKPVSVGEHSVTELVLREPTAAQWQEWDRLEGVEMDIAAVATVSGVSITAVRMIGARDLIQGARYISRFLG